MLLCFLERKKDWSTNILMLKKIIPKQQWASADREAYDESIPAVGQVPSVVGPHSWKRQIFLRKCGCSSRGVEVIPIYPHSGQSISLTKATRSVNCGNLRTYFPSTPPKKLRTNKQMPHWIKFSLTSLVTDIFLWYVEMSSWSIRMGTPMLGLLP